MFNQKAAHNPLLQECNRLKIMYTPPPPVTYRCFLLYITVNLLTLYGCIKPVDFDAFLNDSTVQEIIKKSKTGKVITGIEFGIEDICPQLLNNDTVLHEGDTVIIRKSPASESVIITVTNAEIYTEIYWFYNSIQLTDEASFTVSAADPQFLYAKTYLITVVGLTDDNKAYGITFNIKVES